MSKQKCGVIGTAVSRPGPSMSLEEAIYHTALEAVSDAGITMDDIEGIVVASNDQLDGRAIAIMAASGSVGGVGRDIQSTPSGSEHAFVLGALRVRSGLFQTQLVVSWSPLEVDSIHDVEHLAADPYFHRSLPLDELSALALQAVRLGHEVPGLQGIAQQVSDKNLGHAQRKGAAVSQTAQPCDTPSKYWPLTQSMVAAPDYGVVATVLVSDSFLAGRARAVVAWIEGVGWATEPGYLGDRNLAQLPSLKAAANRAYSDAGVINPSTSFSLAEVADRSPYQELLAYEGLGLCPRDKWAEDVSQNRFAEGGNTPVNLSGGSQAFNPVYCRGLVSIAEAARQVMGRAGHSQASGVRTVVAHASSGFAMQYNTVVVMRAGLGERSSV